MRNEKKIFQALYSRRISNVHNAYFFFCYILWIDNVPSVWIAVFNCIVIYSVSDVYAEHHIRMLFLSQNWNSLDRANIDFIIPFLFCGLSIICFIHISDISYNIQICRLNVNLKNDDEWFLRHVVLHNIRTSKLFLAKTLNLKYVQNVVQRIARG